MTIAEKGMRRNPLGTPQNEEKGLRFWKRIPREFLVIATLILASTGSFGLGMVAGRESRAGKPDDSFWIEQLGQVGKEPAAEVAVEPEKKVPKAATKKAEPVAQAAGGEVVASKSGTKYYLPWCGSVNRIKEENKVWFASKAEAEAAGYGPAKNCKGL